MAVKIISLEEVVARRHKFLDEMTVALLGPIINGRPQNTKLYKALLAVMHLWEEKGE